MNPRRKRASNNTRAPRLGSPKRLLRPTMAYSRRWRSGTGATLGLRASRTSVTSRTRSPRRTVSVTEVPTAPRKSRTNCVSSRSSTWFPSTILSLSPVRIPARSAELPSGTSKAMTTPVDDSRSSTAPMEPRGEAADEHASDAAARRGKARTRRDRMVVTAELSLKASVAIRGARDRRIALRVPRHSRVALSSPCRGTRPATREPRCASELRGGRRFGLRR